MGEVAEERGVLARQVPGPVVRTIGPSREVHLTGVGTPTPRPVPGLAGVRPSRADTGNTFGGVDTVGTGEAVVVVCRPLTRGHEHLHMRTPIPRRRLHL